MAAVIHRKYHIELSQCNERTLWAGTDTRRAAMLKDARGGGGERTMLAEH